MSKKPILNMNMTNFNTIVGKIFSIIGLMIILSNSAFAQNTDAVKLYENLKSMNNATQLIEEKKYEEAKKILEKIEIKDLDFLKNQHLGDISFLEGKYVESLAYYKIAQINSKDKVMSDYVQKKIQYVQSVKIK